MTKTVAIIVGNGTSRSAIDLNTLVGQGTIYGCNALYRDFKDYDHLVAIDDGMIEEIKDDPKAIIPPVDERYESSEYSPFARRRSNAGMNAMYEAVKSGHDILYCLGFDFLLEGDISVDNVYKDTSNYGPETKANVADNYNRVKYLEWFINRFPHIQFVFVMPDGAKFKSIEGNNLIGMDISTFTSKI
jgi:hypothetical protein